MRSLTEDLGEGLTREHWADGSVSYYKNNLLHRGGGKPALIHADGDRYWFIEGEGVTEAEAVKWARGQQRLRVVEEIAQ